MLELYENWMMMGDCLPIEAAITKARVDHQLFEFAARMVTCWSSGFSCRFSSKGQKPSKIFLSCLPSKSLPILGHLRYCVRQTELPTGQSGYSTRPHGRGCMQFHRPLATGYATNPRVSPSTAHQYAILAELMSEHKALERIPYRPVVLSRNHSSVKARPSRSGTAGSQPS